jgi:SAM-dependent methyltransferase
MSEDRIGLTQLFHDLLGEKANLSLLEAGCGSASHVSIPNVARTVGIDLLFTRVIRNRLLDSGVVGDLGDLPFRPESFDVTVSWDVLEHLPDPRSVLRQLLAATRPDGLVILAFPHIFSWKGLITKITPFWVHALFYRYVVGDKRRGDLDQFPTYLRLCLEPGRLRRFGESLGFLTVFFTLYEGPVQSYLRHQSRLWERLFSGLGALSRLVSLGRCDLNLSDVLIVFRRESA